MEKRVVKLVSKAHRQRAIALVSAAPEGYVVQIGEETRSQEQNRLLWPLIADIQNQAMQGFSADDIKLRFLHALGVELRFLPELEGAGMFPVGQRSSTLTKGQFSGLISLLYEWGERNGVKWSQTSHDNMEGYVR